ncbi:DUF1758 domain-containing protein [Trichonephila clavipes]|uniref:DUF1758 domain-containing protein n=1 Tax=Trichonephila clavipes TaxID=2585209 RepID=A0A8X6WGJ6_TRICX|nr:DUF1758 domain-containing protein [Trichonephila clavipes]
MLKGQSLSLGDNKPFADRSDLGWVVAGNVPSEEMFSSIAVNRIQVVTDELVSNFWKLDSVPEEYLTLGYMELVPKNDYAKRKEYYFPHHVVLRDSSSTTKLRVVFDVPAKSTSGYSLNDLVMVGPRVQQDVYPILLSFRTFQIAVCADRLGKDVPSNKDLFGRYQLATNSMER